MLTNLWNCFETTGDINSYLSFKEYEEARSGIGFINESCSESITTQDGANES